MGEGDDVVDARSNKHEKHGQLQHRVVRQELQQARGDGRQDDKVGDDQRAGEFHIAKRSADPNERHLHEGGEQHQGKGGVDRALQAAQAWNKASQHRPGGHCGEIQPDLPRFQCFPDPSRSHVLNLKPFMPVSSSIQAAARSRMCACSADRAAIDIGWRDARFRDDWPIAGAGCGGQDRNPPVHGPSKQKAPGNSRGQGRARSLPCLFRAAASRTGSCRCPSRKRCASSSSRRCRCRRPARSCRC